MLSKLFYIEEPKLTFGHGEKIIDPRDGITLFGPFTQGQINIGNIGIIGTNAGIRRLKTWLEVAKKPIFSREPDPARPYFPGIDAAFSMSIPDLSIQEIEIDGQEIDKLLKHADNHQRVHKLVSLYADMVIDYKKQQEVPVTMWFVVIPNDVYKYGRPTINIPTSRDNILTGIKDPYERYGPTLFPEIQELQEAYLYEVNFHNQLKAKLLKDGIITQIIREQTIAYEELLQSQWQIDLLRKFDSAKAWNILTTLYYKMGGLPWKLGTVREHVCYLGLVYKKVETSIDERTACCGAQLFLDSGDGMVFRGSVGPWYNPETKEYHLSETSAYDLLEKALTMFKKTNGNYPKEVFIHAQTYFDDNEWHGFEEAAQGKTKVVGVRINDKSALRLYRAETYAIPRGMAMKVSDTEANLWTKGFIPRIQTQTGSETPIPLQIKITRGESDIETVCKDVLSLTKLNYNACIYGDGVPVTLKFANMIGEVLTAGPTEDIQVLPFKNYI